MKYLYPAVFTQDADGTYMVEVRELPGLMTCGRTMPEAVEMIKDATEMWLCDAEKKKELIPDPTPIDKIELSGGQTVALVLVDTDDFRRKHDTRAVKKTLTIPAWMAYEAEEAGFGLSQVLQEALRQKLGVAPI